MAELGTEPRLSSPRTRCHSVAFHCSWSRHGLPRTLACTRDRPCQAGTRRDPPGVPVSACACLSALPSKGQEEAGQLLGTFLTGETKRKRKTEKKIVIWTLSWMLQPVFITTSFGQIGKGLQILVEGWSLSACSYKRSLWEKIYTFLVPKGTILHYSYVAGLQISSAEELVCKLISCVLTNRHKSRRKGAKSKPFTLFKSCPWL